MKSFSPCIWLNNHREGEVLYIGCRLLYLKKGATTEVLLIVIVFSLGSQLYYFKN